MYTVGHKNVPILFLPSSVQYTHIEGEVASTQLHYKCMQHVFTVKTI